MAPAQQSSGTMSDQGATKKIWVTLTGLPLTVKLDWPFHQSTSGADFWVLHGDIRLEAAEGLYALVAVNLSNCARGDAVTRAQGRRGSRHQRTAQRSGPPAD